MASRQNTVDRYGERGRGGAPHRMGMRTRMDLDTSVDNLSYFGYMCTGRSHHRLKKHTHATDLCWSARAARARSAWLRGRRLALPLEDYEILPEMPEGGIAPDALARRGILRVAQKLHHRRDGGQAAG